MFKPFELFIGLRYTRARRQNHFISFISGISMGGVALGVAALIVVLSVMNGFEQELRSRILGMTSHAVLGSFSGDLYSWQEVSKQVVGTAGVTGVAPYVETEGMLRHGRAVSGAIVRGIIADQEAHVSEVGQHMLAGSLDALRSGEYGVVLGKVLAHVLNASVGDEVDLLVPQSTVTPAGVFPRTRRFRVVGIFEVGMFEYDRTQAMIHLEDAQRLNRMEGGVTGLRLKLADLFAAPQIAQQLNDDLPAGYYVTDWTRQHANFFRAIRTEKTVMFVILALVVAVAAFNIVSTLVMMVADKRGDIAILRTLGASPVSVMMIFMVQGVLIGVVGTIVGVSLGVLLALNVETLVPWIEQFSGVNFVPSDVYQISTVPSKLEISDVTRVSLMSLMLSFVSTLYPAWRASRTDPAEALRYE